MQNFLVHWKTTCAGILSAILGIVPAGSAFLAGLQALYGQQPGHGPADYRLAIWGMALSFVAAVARVWIGLLQNDAPTANQIGQIAQTTMNTGVPAPTAAIPPTTPATK